MSIGPRSDSTPSSSPGIASRSSESNTKPLPPISAGGGLDGLPSRDAIATRAPSAASAVAIAEADALRAARDERDPPLEPEVHQAASRSHPGPAPEPAEPPAPRGEDADRERHARPVRAQQHGDQGRDARQRGAGEHRQRAQAQHGGREQRAERPHAGPGRPAVVLEERPREREGEHNAARRDRQPLHQGGPPCHGPFTHDRSPHVPPRAALCRGAPLSGGGGFGGGRGAEPSWSGAPALQAGGRWFEPSTAHVRDPRCSA